jgi:hypothetical protein
MDNTVYKIECGFAKYFAIGFYYDNHFIGRAIQIIIPGFFITFRIPRNKYEKEGYKWKLFKFINY